MTGKRAVVTGAAGFIGGACARLLLARGWDVCAVVHNRQPAGLHGATIVRASITEKRALLAALVGRGPFDAVVHCAGRASDIGEQIQFRQANYQGVLNVIACMGPVGIERLVHISTSDVYGISDFRQADESTPFRNNLVNPYPRFKIMAERAIVRLLPRDRYVILRPGAVWGPGDRSLLPRMLKYFRQSPAIFHFGRWGGCNRWPLAHVENVARAAFLAASCDDGLGQAFNVVDSEVTSAEQFFRMLQGAFLPDRVGLRSITLPYWVGFVIGAASTFLSNLLGLDHPLFEPSLYGLYSASRNLDLSGEKLKRWFAAHGERMVNREEGLAALTSLGSTSMD